LRFPVFGHIFFIFFNMSYKKISPVKKDVLNVIIETPKGCQNKYSYNKEYGIFQVKKTLPMGTTFPFDFGFVPNTLGQDGDPLDVLVIMDEHSYPGCLVETRILGVLEARQSEEGKVKMIRNDRLIAVAKVSVLFKDITTVKELNKSMVAEIENFFIDYNKHEGRKFEPLNWKGRSTAVQLVKKSIIFKA